MHFGESFEKMLIKDLREVFHYNVVASGLKLNREGKVDFTIFGWRNYVPPSPIDIQVTLQKDNGDKLQWFLRKAWFRGNGRSNLYVIVAGTAKSIIVAQAIHRTLWRDFVGIARTGISRVLWVDDNGLGTLHDPSILARDLIRAHHAQTATSARRCGWVVGVNPGGVCIKAKGGKFFWAPFSEVVGGHGFNRFTARKMITQKRRVSFLPQNGGENGTHYAKAVMIAKRRKIEHYSGLSEMRERT